MIFGAYGSLYIENDLRAFRLLPRIYFIKLTEYFAFILFFFFLAVKSVFKPLNKPQRTAILKVFQDREALDAV